uniref:Uncharacterized protein n=1 Tax=viral metagenome TaxID=1070528 RepID=A0A6M3XX14_9ZZZZ
MEIKPLQRGYLPIEIVLETEEDYNMIHRALELLAKTEIMESFTKDRVLHTLEKLDDFSIAGRHFRDFYK